MFVIPVADLGGEGLAQPERRQAVRRIHDRRRRQKIFPADGGYSARTDIAPPQGSPDLKSLKIVAVDDDYIEKETARIKRRFNEIFQGGRGGPGGAGPRAGSRGAPPGGGGGARRGGGACFVLCRPRRRRRQGVARHARRRRRHPLHYKTVMDREQDADNITREVLIAVRRTFITPFDRGDIKDLITSMDNAIDQMQKTAKTIMLFDQRAFTPQHKEMADAIVMCAELVQEAMPLLSRSTPRPAASARSARRFRRSRAAPTSCTTPGCASSIWPMCRSNSMAFFIGVEIYDHLEKVVDRFDDVGNEIHGIVIENV